MDPLHGYLYWSDWGDRPHIGRAALDGSAQSHIVTEDLGWPNALTIAFDTNELFFGDAREDYVAVCNLDGTGVRKVISRASNPAARLHHIFAMSVFEDYLYWTDWETKSIERCHRYSGEEEETILTAIHRPMDLKVYHPLRQPAPAHNPCENNGGCHALCLLRPGGPEEEGSLLQRSCACPENFVLGGDGLSCVSNCSSNMFLCAATYKCIPFWWKCDGQGRLLLLKLSNFFLVPGIDSGVVDQDLTFQIVPDSNPDPIRVRWFRLYKISIQIEMKQNVIRLASFSTACDTE